MTRLAFCWPAAARRTSPSTSGRNPSVRGVVRPGRFPAKALPEMSFPIGPATLAEIYISAADELPLDPDQWEARAAAVLEPGPFDYIAGGAGGESTMRANRDAFARWRLRAALVSALLGERPRRGSQLRAAGGGGRLCGHRPHPGHAAIGLARSRSAQPVPAVHRPRGHRPVHQRPGFPLAAVRLARKRSAG